jgi:hypothetical protein
VGEKERGKRERKRGKMSDALGEGTISTPLPTVGTTYVKNGKKEEKWKY